MPDFDHNLARSQSGTYYTPEQLTDFVRDAIGQPWEWRSIRRRNRPALYNLPASFDTEFSSFDVYNDGSLTRTGTVYLWGFGLNGLVTIGHSTREFAEWLPKLATMLGTGEGLNLRVYVHNLGADFQYIRKWFDWVNLFAREERQPMSATTDTGIEFRDSLVLVGESLASWARDLLHYKIRKMEGDLDYTLMRHAQTPITPEEMCYMIHDCLVPMCGIMEKMAAEGGRLDRVPMTKTGYARRLCRSACLTPKLPAPEGETREERKARHEREHRTGWAYQQLMQRLSLTTEEFVLAQRAFAGGFTHSNSGYVMDETPLSQVDSYDFASSYPAQMVMSPEYPMGRGVKVDLAKCSYSDLERIMGCYWTMFRVRFYGLEPIITQDNYISVSKCLHLSGHTVNNGRVVTAAELEICITGIDFEIIRRCYTWRNIAFGNFWRYQRGYLPRPIIDTVLQLYRDKSVLKGVVSMEEQYMLSKQQLNSLFGMMVTSPVAPVITYDYHEWTHTPQPIEEAVLAYNEDKRRFTSYLWGITITALSRRALWSGILECGEDYLYSDTDSLKILNASDHAAYISSYNAWCDQMMERAASAVGFDVMLTRPITPDGKQKFLGHWEHEGTYSGFQARGAKRYMVQEGSYISLTVSGVNKNAAIPYLCRSAGVDFKPAMGGAVLSDPADGAKIFSQFCDGLTIPGTYEVDGRTENASGKLLHLYNDEASVGMLTDYLGNVAPYEERSSLYLSPTSYRMGMSAEFVRFCLGIHGDSHIEK